MKTDGWIAMTLAITYNDDDDDGDNSRSNDDIAVDF